MSNRVLKKTIAVLLAIMLLLSLTACGTDGNDASDQQSVLSSQTDTNDATQNADVTYVGAEIKENAVYVESKIEGVDMYDVFLGG
ncbi:MAG: hypothetical protein IJC55_04650, partial [Clostridia bacterium]|nr:hypothetical protein [Clostridia bacterium]